MTKTKTAIEALEKIQSAADTASMEVRDVGDLEIGQAIHQGDVYLWRVPSNHPKGELLGTRQIAVGTSVGSRHVVEGREVFVYAGVKYPEGFTEPEGCPPNTLLGPVVVVKGGSMLLTHPEHAHHCVKGAQTFQTTYQFDARTMRQVAD